MATSDIPESRSRRRKVTIALVVILWILAYWPGGPFIEQMLSPAAFLIWVVLVLPGLATLLFAFNAYKNLQYDDRLESDRTAGGGDA